MMTDHPADSWHILGAGAIGSLWACHLTLAGCRTRLILRNQHRVDHFSGELSLSEQGADTLIPLCAEAPNAGGSIQRLLVTTKSYDTLLAIDSIRHRLTQDSLIVLLQNGMGQQQQVADLLPDIALYAGTTTEGAYKLASNQLVHAGHGESWIGPINPAARRRHTKDLSSLFKLPLVMGYDEEILRRLWQKLAINAAINGLTAQHDCQNGQLADNAAYRNEMQQLCREVEQLARALQQPLFDRPLLDQALQVARATATNYSSMLQDVRHGRHTEIDYINGYICRQARQLALGVPNNQALVDAITSRHPHLMSTEHG